MPTKQRKIAMTLAGYCLKRRHVAQGVTVSAKGLVHDSPSGHLIAWEVDSPSAKLGDVGALVVLCTFDQSCFGVQDLKLLKNHLGQGRPALLLTWLPCQTS